MYKIEFTKQAVKDLKLIQKDYQIKILSTIKELALDPFNKKFDVKKLKGTTNSYRIRVGSYRIIYEIENNILIIKIQTRGNVYG